jgi:hypothetical protein
MHFKRKDAELIWEQYTMQTEGLDTAGHVALDLVGLIPGVGEFADGANALLHAKKGEYLMAALSIISFIPIVGDAIGKSGKVAGYLAKAGKTGKVIGRGAEMASAMGPGVKKAKMLIKTHQEDINKVMAKVGENEKLAEYVPEMQQALNTFAEVQ